MMCFYSEEYNLSELLKKYSNGRNTYRCIHPNSPFFNELVSDKNLCRLYLDEKEYFKMKDRKDRLNEIKNKISGSGKSM
jgi:hypothetical protein